MAELIRKTSVLYKRRLAREINYNESGCYHRGRRVYQAKVQNDQLKIRIFVSGKDQWITIASLETEKFYDGYGREICASRQVK